ncbi:MAG: DUF2207 domain-containing protein [Ruminococcaceae bacterium]|nr:DUF2207 domain-containing protein [Oscillospiraceae bacterium]
MAGIATAIIGAIIVILGIINMTGNIASLHWYHRKNVSEENRKPFGRLVGLGTLIVGVSVMLFGGAMALFGDNEAIVLVATALLIVGIIVGLVISLRAMNKYNGGIF